MHMHSIPQRLSNRWFLSDRLGEPRSGRVFTMSVPEQPQIGALTLFVLHIDLSVTEQFAGLDE